ncbi:hypothetical protein TNCV_3429491 [Trichonephila clavipes]|nr:hypothetical protein TNCV_3429491 [Trichonephila clavipes]
MTAVSKESWLWTRCRHVMSLSPDVTEECVQRRRCKLNLSRFKLLPLAWVWKFRDVHANIPVSRRNFTPEIREFMSSCGNLSYSFSNFVFRPWMVLEGMLRVVIALPRMSHACSIPVVIKLRSTEPWGSTS